MALLENFDESPCFGCGPRHARGLRLAFDQRTGPDGGEEVACTYTPKPDEVGWPGLFHTGLHYLVVYEASYWGAWALGGHVAIPLGAASWEQKRLPRVGEPFTARARLVELTAGGLRTRAVSEGPDGRPLATLDASWKFSRRGKVEGLGLPDYLLRDMLP